MNELVKLFREHGYRITPQRQCVFRLLQGNVSHPSAESIYREASREMSSLSLQTVYRILADLVFLGEISSVDLGTGTLRFDPNVEVPHHHLVCQSCGKVADLFVDLRHPEVPDDYKQDFEVSSTEVVFRGRCRACMEEEKDLEKREYQFSGN
ncbi:MAG: Fur family transcriptional regulator [Acidimicrobiales bacterium]